MRDRARDAELLLAGYRVLRPWRQITEQPHEVARILRRLLDQDGYGGLHV